MLPPPHPPTSFPKPFADDIGKLLGELGNSSFRPLIIGDLNCPGASSYTSDKRLLDILVTHDFCQSVVVPTHSAACAAQQDSLLDLIIHPTSCSWVSDISVSDPGISDHSLISLKLAGCIPPAITSTFFTRNFKHLDRTLFAESISRCSFIVSPSNDTDSFCQQMNTDIVSVLDKLAPLVKMTKRVSSHPRCSLSQEAIDAKRHRRTCERNYRKSRTDVNRLAFREASHTARALIKTSYLSYTTNLIDGVRHDSKKLWKQCHELLHNTINRSPNNCSIKPDSFNDFFIKKVVLIRSKISTTLALLPPYIAFHTPPVVSKLAQFPQVSLEDVLRVISDMPGKSSSQDVLPTYLLKELSPLFAPSIQYLSNLSFSTSTFPSCLKTGCILPLLKKPSLDASEVGNYRPITSLSSLSKILERLALIHLRPLITGADCFPTMQSAYRAAHSTESALLKITSDIRNSMDTKAGTCLLSLDISAAFDALDHQILLQRAQDSFGLSHGALAWLRSYLSNRSAYTSVDGLHSSTQHLPTGVPQGSTLGPILFALYVAPLGPLVESQGVTFHQYADDTQLYIALDSVEECLDALSACADRVNMWFLNNFLMLNTSKTEAILFGTGARLRALKLNECTPFSNSAPITLTKSIHLLGVTLDSELSMSQHVGEVIQKCNYHIRALKYIRPSLTTEVANTIACSLVLTRLDYCNSLLYGTSDSNLRRLQVVQNRAARVVLKAGRRSSATSLLVSLHWLPIISRIKYKVAVLAYNALSLGQPSYLANFLSRDTFTRSHRSHEQNQLRVPRRNLGSAVGSFLNSAPVVWNSISLHTKEAPNRHVFGKRLKRELFTGILSSSSSDSFS